MFAVGGLFGGLGCGPIITALGLRATFAINNLILISAGLMMAFSPEIELFTAGRFIVGVGSGITTVRSKFHSFPSPCKHTQTHTFCLGCLIPQFESVTVTNTDNKSYDTRSEFKTISFPTNTT